jgi:hypothetical protein
MAKPDQASKAEGRALREAAGIEDEGPDIWPSPGDAMGTTRKFLETLRAPLAAGGGLADVDRLALAGHWRDLPARRPLPAAGACEVGERLGARAEVRGRGGAENEAVASHDSQGPERDGGARGDRAGQRCDRARDLAGRALALKPSDVSLAAHSVRVLNGKGSKATTRGFHPSADDTLARWLDTRKALGLRNGPLFCTLAGRPLHPQYVRNLLGRLAPAPALTSASTRTASGTRSRSSWSVRARPRSSSPSCSVTQAWLSRRDTWTT